MPMGKTEWTERAETQGVVVEVESRYIPDRSIPDRDQYFFAYRIRITNDSAERVQLQRRHWIITDGLGRTEEVEGPGVVGEQPWIEPGDAFQYESFCPLSTPTGCMKGRYQMLTSRGEAFSAEIPQFFLVEPASFH